MCGIVGYIGEQLASDVILDGLKRLEYRGYDSAGLAVIDKVGSLEIRREVGKLKNLISDVVKNPISGRLGIGHTRWATHGRPTVFNAHPHSDASGKLVVVHNGIIENYLELKERLKEKYAFNSDTDTEVLANLIIDHYKGNLFEAVREALQEVSGAYAIAVIHAEHDDQIVIARNSSPLIVGVGENENFVASDVPAILSYTRDIVYLNDNELGIVYADRMEFFDLDGNKLDKKVSKISWSVSAAEKGGFDHFMIKEIHEQPTALANAFAGRTSESQGRLYLDELELTPEEISSIDRIAITACGTSLYAGLLGKYYIEKYAKIPVDIEFASEFRYREPVLNEKTLVIGISQSGETADTLAAIRLANTMGAKTVGILNVIGSAISRETHGNLYIHCGPEIGVASTKAFTSTIACLYLLALYFGQVKQNLISEDEMRKHIISLKSLPKLIEGILNTIQPDVKKVAKKLANYKDCLYLGRHYNYPIALEGALKMKELSYIHAEGYPAGEMKHGPIALIDEDVPIISIATDGCVYDKMLSNIQQVKARDALTISLATKGNDKIAEESDYVIYLPKIVNEDLSPFINIIPLQLLAYYVALLKGCDVDQPRNLAKSVTVE